MSLLRCTLLHSQTRTFGDCEWVVVEKRVGIQDRLRHCSTLLCHGVKQNERLNGNKHNRSDP